MVTKSSGTAPYFPPHLQKAQYEELAEMYSPEDEYGSKILTSALLRRAMVDVQRIWQIREEKPPLQNLVRSGVLGEDMMEKITLAEKELEVEIHELMEEAELYKAGWGKNIFQEASTFMQQQANLAQQQAQAAAVAAQQGGGAPATSPAAATNALTEEEKEERARKAAEELLAEEEKERKSKSGGGKKKKGK
ncbi:translocation protein S66 [Irineochytrium annulatum]|nr:translocation protein S66 [Irineochytrium annulatum]